MIKQLLNLMSILITLILFSACEKNGAPPEVSQPVITQYASRADFMVGGEKITTGPLKDYEQESDVVYKLTVSSEFPLSKFMVKTTSDAFSSDSRILRTEPANAIDEQGNFTSELREVVVYYAYRIHPSVPASSIVVVDFTFQNRSNFIGTTSNTFTVIKKGSTNGKLLTVIDMPGINRYEGIGIQDNLDILSGVRGANGANINYRKGAFYSMSLRSDMVFTEDAISLADKVDFVGYRSKTDGTNPVLANGNFYLVSPSNLTILTSTYAGAVAATVALTGTSGTANITVGGITRLATFTTNTTTSATNFVNTHKAAYTAAGLNLMSNAANLVWTALQPGVGFSAVTIATVTGDLFGNEVRDAKNDLLASTIKEMGTKLQAEGKALNKVYFKRLDNITGSNRVTPAAFNLLTHDNEFDILLAGIVAEDKTYTGAMGLNQVYGFVAEDGRRGIIKTQAVNVATPTGTVTINPPNSGDGVLFCTIKVQENIQ
jgi:hypothetical protein